ncbi:transposase [Candidatus Jettenia caeni]|uniref:Transposase n=1 Tax=Candidatus Jettenia caeni TaxID=247490 RepID=I3IGV2_9BACT|nr:transposase [Candidatus Jettenia caeni]GJQ47248.1 MAG: hypothetical protein JETCAE04_30020 [Candidatus Jettenia caeni]
MCIVTDGHGVPLSITVAGANRHDMKMAEATIKNIVIKRPKPTREKPQNLCLDKGFDVHEIREAVAAQRYRAHIRTRGEEMRLHGKNTRYRARRWVAERTHSWMNRFRRLLI